MHSDRAEIIDERERRRRIIHEVAPRLVRIELSERRLIAHAQRCIVPDLKAGGHIAERQVVKQVHGIAVVADIGAGIRAHRRKIMRACVRLRRALLRLLPPARSSCFYAVLLAASCAACMSASVTSSAPQ